jgi:hypothetical protein
MSSNPPDNLSEFRTAVREVATDATLSALRHKLAIITAEVFTNAGEELHAVGHIFGNERKHGLSPHGHASDEVAGVSLLLRIAGQLTLASAELFAKERTYAAAALLRQLVEVEYLAWAFEARDRDAERWLRSTREERETFFKPAKLRQASQGKFRGKDYGYHCELGGHPVPGAGILLTDDIATNQLLLSDLLGHTGRIWDHLLDWVGKNPWAAPLINRREGMYHRYNEWKKSDHLVLLPPPP